jgi:hypothetical protein
MAIFAENTDFLLPLFCHTHFRYLKKIDGFFTNFHTFFMNYGKKLEEFL